MPRDKKNTDKDNQRINPQSLEEALVTIRSRFKAGEVKKMNDISKIYITGIVAALGIGYNGYVTKLSSPEYFTIEDLLKLADVTETEFDLIWEVAKKEALKNHKKRNIDHLLKTGNISED
jgi:hypothetical protein